MCAGHCVRVLWRAGGFLRLSVSVCLILRFLCVSDELCVYVWFNVYFSQTDLWLSATVAPAKLLSPNTLCTHYECLSVGQRQSKRREKQFPQGGCHNIPALL